MSRPFCTWLTCLLAASSVASAVESAATLRWQNGETLPGELLEAGPADAVWKTPLFDDPLALGWHALRRIERSLPAAATSEPFSIVLRNGSHFFGDLVALAPDVVTVRSAHHGDVRLKRSEVLHVRRLRGGAIVFAGPAGDAGWVPLADRKGSDAKNKPGAGNRSTLPSLATGPGGTLALPYWNGAAFLDLSIPAHSEVEFRLSSSKRPDFQLSIEGAPKQRVRIETWDEQLVLAVGDDFRALQTIAEDERSVALRIRWDRDARKCFVSTTGGELLAEMPVPDDTQSSGTGLLLENKGRNLTLESLRVRAWEGKEPAAFDPAKPRVEMADGRVLEGEAVEAAEGTLRFRAGAGGEDQVFPLAEVSAVILSADAPQPRDSETTVALADGTLLFGRIASVAAGRAFLAVPFAEDPISMPVKAMRQMLLKMPPPADAGPERPLAELDKLVIRQSVLHGILAGSDDASLRWLPVGGKRPARPAHALPLEITRAFPPDAEPPNAPALFYTTAGDVLPGTLRTIDRTGVEIESAIVGAKKLSPGDLNAIHFDAESRFAIKGFTDPAWRVVLGDASKIQRTADKLVMQPDSALGHPMAMQAGEIKFRFDSTNFCAVRLRLFCAGTDGKKAMNLIVMRMGERVSAGIESTEGQFEDQTQTRLSSTEPLAVKLVIQDKGVDLHLNDVQTRRFVTEPGTRAGAGLVIEPASMWGNSVQPIVLAAFSAVSAPGRSWVPEVQAETRTQTLTIPRFRKEDPPRHVLLAGNGDLLRGEIAAVTSTHFGFRSGLETLQIPRNRVKAAIWLAQPASDGSAIAVERSPTAAILDQRIVRRFSYRNAVLSALVRVLQQEAPALKVKLPPSDDTHRATIQFGGLTIGQALDQICSRIGLRHRIDAEGVVVIEAGAGTPADMVERIYWLKADAFAPDVSVKDTLIQKGVPFPSGATAQWQAGGRQLAVTNTAANHAKVATLWRSESGEPAPVLTHWFQLSDGGQLGLQVEQFGPDTISGQHPVYGPCRFPVARVVTVRTSRPIPAPATAAFSNWRLTFAPEPVLAETGGQASPLLGKPAKPFKRPLLGGGEFDLALEKGKVVVLDFWATWCGPCIKSLPELIETVGAFPSDRVKLIGLNQSEPAEAVTRFLETRQWKLTVALDSDQSIARQYGVEGIPFTVVIGPDGNVAYVASGYSADSGREIAATVQRLLAAP